MNIESLDQGIVEKEVIKHPVHICFTALEHQRWVLIRRRLKEINPKLKIQEFARISLRELMDKLDELIDKHSINR